MTSPKCKVLYQTAEITLSTGHIGSISASPLPLLTSYKYAPQGVRLRRGQSQVRSPRSVGDGLSQLVGDGRSQGERLLQDA